MKWLVIASNGIDAVFVISNDYLNVYDWAINRWNGEQFSIQEIDKIPEFKIDE